MKRLYLLIFLIIFSWNHVTIAEDNVRLMFSPPVSDSLTYSIESVIKSSGSNLLGSDMSMNASSIGDITLNIQQVTKSDVHTELKSDNLLITVQSPVQTRSYNLATKDGKGIKVVFGRNGKVTEIKNLNALRQQNVMNFSIIQILRNYFPSFPDKHIKIGDTWKDNTQMKVPFQGMQLNVLMNVTYKLDSIITTQQGREASISAEYMVSIHGNRPFGKGKAVFQGSGSGTGYLHFLVSKGYFTEYRLDYEIDSKVNIKSGGKTIMEVPLNLSASATLQKI